jgi:uncharacterized protein (DUF2126 family)
MKVDARREAPRVTKPYTDEQWARSTRSASASTPTSRGDVRLTMGGEPTFVSVDDRDGANGTPRRWGRPSARCAPTMLLRKLKRALRAGGCCTSARASGIRASSCRAGRSAATGARTASRSGATRAVRRRARTGAAPRRRERFLARSRSAWASIRRSTCSPAYEDVWYYLWRERKLPVNVDPFDARLDDELERARLRGVRAGPRQGGRLRAADRAKTLEGYEPPKDPRLQASASRPIPA